MVPIGRMASAVAHDPRGLLAFDNAVDARHPGADLVHELPLTQRQNVIGPFADTGGSGFDPGWRFSGGRIDCNARRDVGNVSPKGPTTTIVLGFYSGLMFLATAILRFNVISSLIVCLNASSASVRSPPLSAIFFRLFLIKPVTRDWRRMKSDNGESRDFEQLKALNQQ